MYRILEALGNPQHALPPTIHIAGTNGKGSTLAFLRAILAPASIHSYISPHLVDFHERITLNGAPISEARLIDVLSRCQTANDGGAITFFEITTAAAFLAFSERPADWLLLEVGLGGRLDATNVMTPQLSVITPIDIDHTDFLGPHLHDIAHEKAGIIKPNIPVVAAPQAPIAEKVLIETAQKLNAPLWLGGRDWHVLTQDDQLVFTDHLGSTTFPLPGLVGAHQIINAGTAIAAARLLKCTDAAIARGLPAASWPARLQHLQYGPLIEHARQQAPSCQIWLDGGHNPAAARILGQWLIQTLERPTQSSQAPRQTPLTPPPHMLVGLLNSKDARGYFEALADQLTRGDTAAALSPHRRSFPTTDPETSQNATRHISQKIIQPIIQPIIHCVAIPEQENAAPAQMLAEEARKAGFTAHAYDDPMAIALPPEAPRLLICGSLYLAGWVLRQNG